MFKKQDISYELAVSMENHLVGNTIEKHAEGLNKLATAIDHISDAAETFDNLGMEKEAEALTTLLEIIAAKKSKKKSKHKARKSKKTDPAIKGLTADKMLNNLKEKGWVFNAEDKTNDNKHSNGCMCSMCMDVNDVRHGDDCVCHICTKNDKNDHINIEEDTPFNFDDTSIDRNHSDDHGITETTTRERGKYIVRITNDKGEVLGVASDVHLHKAKEYARQDAGIDESDFHREDEDNADDNYAEMFRNLAGDMNDFEDEV